MPKLNFQFHALREETAKYIAQRIIEFSLTAVTVNLFPFDYKVYGCQDITASIMANSRLVLLMKREPVIGETRYLEFLRGNSGFLSIAMGKEENKTLHESKIGGESDGELLNIWKNIVSQYKKKMCKGVWVVGASGAERFSSTHCYTPAVKERYEQGWTIRALAGTSTYEFRDHGESSTV